MIKHINHQNFLTTPFAAVKQWELYNVQNDDVVLIEPPDSPEVPVALDYVDYSGLIPTLNFACNIALEQQDGNEVIYQEGNSGSGFFYPDAPQNQDGTYKRLVWDQTWRSFYNLYRDPTKIFGMDHIDFPLGKTDRQISENIRLFNIPQRYWGDRLVPKSIWLYDTSLDDNVEVHDDGYQNLLAGTNLFSKVQEIRTLGNIIIDGEVTNSCETFADVRRFTSDTSSFTIGFLGGSIWESVVTVSGSDSGSVNIGFSSGEVYDYTPIYSDTGSVEVGFESGSLNDVPTTEVAPTTTVGYTYGSLGYRTEYDYVPRITIGFTSGSLFETTVATYQAETASVNLYFESGSLFNSIVWASGSDTASVNLYFESGTLFNQIVPTAYGESSSFSMSFVDGILVDDAIEGASPIAYQTMSIGLLSVTRSVVAGGTGYATGSDGIVVPE